MSSREFSEWMAFFGLEPFGFEAEFLGHAQTAATIANVNRGKGKAMKVQDFMPKEQETQTPEQMIQFAAMFTAAAGGTITADLPTGEAGE